jgi:hypothetical protein
VSGRHSELRAVEVVHDGLVGAPAAGELRGDVEVDGLGGGMAVEECPDAGAGDIRQSELTGVS